LSEYKVDNKALQKILIDRNIQTVQALAEISGISSNTCGKILRGKIFPSSAVMARLAIVLHLDSKTAGDIFFMHNLRNAKVAEDEPKTA